MGDTSGRRRNKRGICQWRCVIHRHSIEPHPTAHYIDTLFGSTALWATFEVHNETHNEMVAGDENRRTSVPVVTQDDRFAASRAPSQEQYLKGSMRSV